MITLDSLLLLLLLFSLMMPALSLSPLHHHGITGHRIGGTTIRIDSHAILYNKTVAEDAIAIGGVPGLAYMGP
jgi:hypothetical protein